MNDTMLVPDGVPSVESLVPTSTHEVYTVYYLRQRRFGRLRARSENIQGDALLEWRLELLGEDPRNRITRVELIEATTIDVTSAWGPFNV